MRILGQILLGFFFPAFDQWMETCEIRIVFFRLQNHSLLIFEHFYGNPTTVSVNAALTP